MLPFGLDLTTVLLVLGAIILVAVVLGLLLGLTGLTGGGGAGKAATELDKQRRGSRNWATWKQVRRDLADDPTNPDPARLRLCNLDGHPLANPRLRSKLVLAPSGAGKTPRVVVPDLLRHDGPAVVTSIKSDVRELTQASREARGQVWVFDPSNPTTSARWSPLAHINTWADALDASRWIQESSKADSSGGVQDREFWDAQARLLLAPLLYLAARSGRTMSDVAELVVDGQETESFVTNQLADLPETGPRIHWARFTGLEHKTKSSVMITAATILEAWTHPRVAETVNVLAGDHDALDLDRLLDGSNTLYLVSPASEQEMFTPIYETLINAITMRVEKAADRGIALNPPLLLALDEAANIAPLRKLDYLASAGAGQGILVLSVWQDEGQIESIYGPAKARTIRANHYATVYLPGIQDHQTLMHLSDQIGRDSMRQTSTSTNRDGTSTTISHHELDVAPPSWLRQLDSGQAIVILGHYAPILGHIPAWYENKKLRAQIPADVAERFDQAFSRSKRRNRRKQTPAPAVADSGYQPQVPQSPPWTPSIPKETSYRPAPARPASVEATRPPWQRDDSAQGWFANEYRKNLSN